MATIEKRTNKAGVTSWRVRIRLQGQKPRCKTFSRKSDAQAWASALEGDLARGYYVPVDNKHTLAEAIDRYIRDVLPFKKRNRSANKIQGHLEWWKAEIGAYSIIAVTPAVIVQARDKLRRQKTYRGTLRSGPTANRFLASLSGVFKVCVREWLWLDDTPMRKISRFEENKGRTQRLDPEGGHEQRDRLLAECKVSRNPHLYLIVVLALSTGARRTELTSLKWAQVKDDRIILTDTKNGDTRPLHLHGLAAELMGHYRKVRTLASPYVFPNQTDPKKPIFIDEAFRLAVTRAGLVDFHFHDLRHSAASYLAENGASLSEIAEILGHKTLQMVKRYSHLTTKHTSSVVKSMNEKLFKK